MPPAMGSDIRTLNDLITSTLALLSQFTTSLIPSSNISVAKPIESPPDPLHVVGDAAKLVKAHTTKLSLLAINKPFTPSAIVKVLKELAGTCLPAMMSAVQICDQDKATWGSVMGKEMQARVRRVFKEMEMLLEEVRAIGAGNESGARRDSLSSTGVVWESCDDLIKLEMLGVVGLAVLKAEQYRDTINDAITELREWAEGDDLDSEGRADGLLDSDDEGVDGDRDSIEDIFNAPNSMPADRPGLKTLAKEADGTLKKIVMLYTALVKRRITTFKSASVDLAGEVSAVFRLDELMQHLKRMPHQVDELASTFYELDEDGARQILEKCLSEAKSACEATELSWDGREDEFTSWSRKWCSAVG